MLAYGSETWVLSKCDEDILGVFRKENFEVQNSPPCANQMLTALLVQIKH